MHWHLTADDLDLGIADRAEVDWIAFLYLADHPSARVVARACSRECVRGAVPPSKTTDIDCFPAVEPPARHPDPILNELGSVDDAYAERQHPTREFGRLS